MVNKPYHLHRWEAPGALEMVRAFLNTWDLSLADRTFVDRLPAVAGDRRAWASTFPELPRPSARELHALQELRGGLRSLVEEGFEPSALNVWLGKLPVEVRVGTEAGDLRLAFLPARAGAAGRLLAIVLDAVSAKTWPRLKSCPDCKLVFYDSTRNRSKVWCGMYAGSDGRACGSIAKVRRWRERRSGSR